MMEVDVAIAGAGPAGSACAISLRDRNESLAVTLIEASRFDEPRAGESLSPAARPLLERLGVLGAFLAAGHVEVHGTSASWGGAAPDDNDYIFHARGPGWHLERPRFDAMLAEQAVSRGATLMKGAAVCEARRECGGWRLQLAGGGEVAARFLVDATGGAAIARRFCGARAVATDTLVSFGRFFEDRAGADRRTIVEAFADGWWYTAAVPAQRRFVACMTDGAVARRLRLNDPECWTRLLDTMPLVGRIARGAQTAGPIVARACGSQRLEVAAGDDWLAAGDAASRFDPLSSQGITKALRSGIVASYAIGDRLIAGDGRGLRRYQHFIQTEFESYLRMRAQVYQQEQRWPRREFWSAR
ncbi:MAG TPA: NAD(P)/FAD-dependent oxidoreductase [Vicinamibacterales bacterium]|jgi:flavin-dependent dehydrogenase|nr:NAD(P)/FAD-dependent oxidoreductase [Vicinamibacterales bacterium]